MKAGPDRDRLIADIHRRSAILARFTKPQNRHAQLDTLIAMFSGHLLETCLVLLGPTFEQEWASRIFDQTAESHGICRFCHQGALDVDKGMCLACWQRIEDDDRNGLNDWDEDDIADATA